MTGLATAAPSQKIGGVTNRLRGAHSQKDADDSFYCTLEVEAQTRKTQIQRGPDGYLKAGVGPTRAPISRRLQGEVSFRSH